MALSAEQVLKFSDNRLKDAWYGPLEELALFNFWKLIKDKAEGLFYTEPLNPNESLTLDFIVDPEGECVFMPQPNGGNDDYATANGAPNSRDASLDHCEIFENSASTSESRIQHDANAKQTLEHVPLAEISTSVSNIEPAYVQSDATEAPNVLSTLTCKQKDPFDKVLIWPRIEPPKKGDRKRRGQEHVPSVATSERWLQWFKKKDQEKQEKEVAQKARLEERKRLKEKKEEERCQLQKKKEEAKKAKIEERKNLKEKREEMKRTKAATKKNKENHGMRKKATESPAADE
ncbi:nucleolar protein 58-like [Armigeres subalbatus]|uniref:nucleolar protein 58-like n=1 Tax=Armigeres subalbatus TaxID=124917 RepID=UPI002ED40D2F